MIELIEVIWFIIFALIEVFYSLIVIRTSIQWIQQSSYRNKRFFKRLFDKQAGFYSEGLFRSTIILNFIVLMLFCIKFFLNKEIFDWLSIIILVTSSLTIIDIIIFSVRRIKHLKQERKPLVFTQRAIRLILLSIIISLSTMAIVTILGVLYLRYYILIVSLVAILSPIISSLANLILLPIEMLINKSFMNDAIRRRASMTELKVVGITGSYGKTSTKNIVNKILSQKYLSIQTPESYNTELGITRVIREQLKPIHQIFIAEMGARQIGDIRKCCEIAQPNYGILTVVGKAHLEMFKSEENIRKTKAELVQYIDKQGTVFMNADDHNTEMIIPTVKAKVVLFGMSSDKADVKAKDISITPNGCKFKLIAKNNANNTPIEEEIKTVLLGKHNIFNILAGISIGLELGVSIEHIKYAISSIEPIPHRLQLIKRSNDITIIDDSFNSNPTGFNEAVNVLASFGKEYRKIIITPGMIELGKEEYNLNKEAGRKIGENCDYVILVGEKRAIPLQDGIKETNFDKNNLYTATNLNDARIHLNEISKKGDVILFENDLPDVYGG